MDDNVDYRKSLNSTERTQKEI